MLYVEFHHDRSSHSRVIIDTDTHPHIFSKCFRWFATCWIHSHIFQIPHSAHFQSNFETIFSHQSKAFSIRQENVDHENSFRLLNSIVLSGRQWEIKSWLDGNAGRAWGGVTWALPRLSGWSNETRAINPSNPILANPILKFIAYSPNNNFVSDTLIRGNKVSKG